MNTIQGTGMGRIWPVLALLLAGSLASGTAFSDKPSHGGGGKKAQHEQRGDSGTSAHFGETHRMALEEYYDEQYAHGRCPPGLAKRHNGCMSPGQAQKWHLGQPLPRDVVYYSVPTSLASQFGPPPAGHRYVRVASDVLLITLRTGIVIEALQSLARS